MLAGRPVFYPYDGDQSWPYHSRDRRVFCLNALSELAAFFLSAQTFGVVVKANDPQITLEQVMDKI